MPVSGTSHSGRAEALVCPCSKGLGLTKCLGGGGPAPPPAPASHSGGLPLPLPVSSASRPSTGEEPMGVAPGKEQRGGEEMGKQGTLHPRKHPGWLLCGGGSRAQTQTDRFKHTQTDSDTHRNPHAQRALPFPSGTHLPPRDSPASLWKPSLACLHPAQDRSSSTPPTPANQRDGFSDAQLGPRSHHPWRGELSSRRLEGRQGVLSQLREEVDPRRGGLTGGWPQQDLDSLCPTGLPPPPRPVLWLGKLVGVVYLAELLTSLPPPVPLRGGQT